MVSERATVLNIAMSLDGYIADESGGVDWLNEVEGEGENGIPEFLDTVDTVIMGRRTYDQVVSFGGEWPYAGKECFVFTSREHPDDPNVQFVSGDVTAFMRDLKARPGSDIWLMGGARLVGSFLRERLVDEYAVAVIPMILGGGIRLFEEGIPRTSLTLTGDERFGDIAMLRYREKGERA